MYQVLVIDDDKLARKGLISLIPWEKNTEWRSPEMWRTER